MPPRYTFCCNYVLVNFHVVQTTHVIFFSSYEVGHQHTAPHLLLLQPLITFYNQLWPNCQKVGSSLIRYCLHSLKKKRKKKEKNLTEPWQLVYYYYLLYYSLNERETAGYYLPLFDVKHNKNK